MAAKTNVNFTKFSKRQKLRLIEKITKKKYELLTMYGIYREIEVPSLHILKKFHQIQIHN